MLTLPSRAERGLVSRGADLVRELVLEEKRKAAASSVGSSGMWRRSNRVKYSIRSVPDADESDSAAPSSESEQQPAPPPPPPPPPPQPKRPPDLHAEHLTFSARLVKYVNERYGGKASVVYKRAGIDRRHYAKIVARDLYAISRETALQFAIGLQLNGSELDDFLRSAGYALTPTLPLDRAFLYCLENGIYNILDVNRIITQAGLPSLRLVF